jgi:hypothetical protein
MIALGEN